VIDVYVLGLQANLRLARTGGAHWFRRENNDLNA